MSRVLSPSDPTPILLDHVRLLRGTTTVFGDLTLRLTESRIGLIGDNGAGKSSLFRLICGLDKPQSGSVSVWGHDAQSQPAERVGLAGMMLHRELELEVQAGIPPARALQNATLLAARVLGQDASLGSVAPGKKADLLLVEGNPVERISDVRRGRLVVKDGVTYDPAALYGALGIAPSP